MLEADVVLMRLSGPAEAGRFSSWGSVIRDEEIVNVESVGDRTVGRAWMVLAMSDMEMMRRVEKSLIKDFTSSERVGEVTSRGSSTRSMRLDLY